MYLQHPIQNLYSSLKYTICKIEGYSNSKIKKLGNLIIIVI